MGKIVESGYVDKSGKLRLPMDRLREFWVKNEGCRIIATFEAVKSGSSDAQRAYYFNYIVPTVQKAMYELGTRLTEAQTDRFMRETYGDEREVREYTTEEMTAFIDWLRQWAAEDLSVYIEDPRVI